MAGVRATRAAYFFNKTLRLLANASMPTAINAHVDGSGTVSRFNVQLTNCDVFPPARSAKNKYHVPFGSVPTNESNNAVGLVESNRLDADCGSIARPSGVHVPTSCPAPL